MSWSSALMSSSGSISKAASSSSGAFSGAKASGAGQSRSTSKSSDNSDNANAKALATGQTLLGMGMEMWGNSILADAAEANARLANQIMEFNVAVLADKSRQLEFATDVATSDLHRSGSKVLGSQIAGAGASGFKITGDGGAGTIRDVIQESTDSIAYDAYLLRYNLEQQKKDINNKIWETIASGTVSVNQAEQQAYAANMRTTASLIEGSLEIASLWA